MTEVIDRDATLAPVKRDTPAATPKPPKLLDQVRDRIRVLHYSRSTEATYIYWIKFYIHFHGLRVGELLALRAEQIRDGAIHLDARTKTGRPRAVPILPPGSRYAHHVPLRMSYDGLRTAFDRAKKDAGLPHIRLHDLRHTVGSLLAESGASLRDIQVWLGHTSPVTSTRYTHVELARLRAVADLVGARNLRAKQGTKGAQQAPVTRETPRETAAK